MQRSGTAKPPRQLSELPNLLREWNGQPTWSHGLFECCSAERSNSLLCCCAIWAGNTCVIRSIAGPLKVPGEQSNFMIGMWGQLIGLAAHGQNDRAAAVGSGAKVFALASSRVAASQWLGHETVAGACSSCCLACCCYPCVVTQLVDSMADAYESINTNVKLVYACGIPRDGSNLCCRLEDADTPGHVVPPVDYGVSQTPFPPLAASQHTPFLPLTVERM